MAWRNLHKGYPQSYPQLLWMPEGQSETRKPTGRKRPFSRRLKLGMASAFHRKTDLAQSKSAVKGQVGENLFVQKLDPVHFFHTDYLYNKRSSVSCISLLMSKLVIANAFAIPLALIALSACGPETNSRYGDKFWDPQDTWDEAAVVTQPELSIVYRDVGDDPDEWEGYVSVDFSDIILRYEEPETPVGLLSYRVGTMDKATVTNFVQAGSTDADSKFFYDSTGMADYRLKLTQPENYTFYLDFAVRQPNGTLKTYNFSWSDIVLPGPVLRDDYWANRINALVVDNCVSCHGGNNADASAEFNMNNNSVANLRTSFIAEINNPTDGKELPSYPFSSDHFGVGAASAIVDEQRDDFNEFVNTLLALKADGQTITNNIVLKTVATPTVMENDPYE